MRVSLGHNHIAVLVARELIEEVLLTIFRTVTRLCSKLLGNLKLRHNGCVVDRVVLYLIANLHCIGQRLGHILEDGIHLGTRLHPLLLRVEHTLGIVQISTCREANKTVVRLGVRLINKVHIVRAYHLDAEPIRELDKMLIYLQLHRVGLVISSLDCSLMQLKLKVIIITKEILMPHYRLLGRLQIASGNLLRNLTSQASRATNQALVILLQLRMICSRTHIETLGPRLRHNLNKVFITLLILGQQDKVITTLILLTLLELQASTRNIHLATDNSLEILLRQ